MTVSHGPSLAEFKVPIRVSGDLRPRWLHFRQNFFSHASDRAFFASATSRLPLRPRLQPTAALSATGKIPFNPQ